MPERLSSTGFVKTSGEEMRLSEFRRKFLESDEGQIVSSLNRFEDPFLPPNVSSNVWRQEGVGPHGNIAMHMDEQRDEAEWFLAFCGDMFSEDDRKKIFATAQIHDWPEFKHGDISFKKRDKIHANKEKDIMRQLISDTYKDDFDPDELERMTESIIEVAYDEESRLGRTFHAIELIGYENAALNAWYNSNGEESDLNTALRVLAHQVIPTHIPELVKLSDDYPPIRKFLIDEIPTFIEIIEEAELCGTQIPDEVDEAKAAIDEFLSELVSNK